MPPSLTDSTACPGLELFICELLANPCCSTECTQNTVISFIPQRRQWSKLYLDPCRLSPRRNNYMLLPYHFLPIQLMRLLANLTTASLYRSVIKISKALLSQRRRQHVSKSLYCLERKRHVCILIVSQAKFAWYLQCGGGKGGIRHGTGGTL
jgi:hypothetical protein